jgi:hypothetical protein
MAGQGNGGWLNSIVGDLTHLRGWVAYSVITAPVFGETAIFLGFALPGERWGAAFLQHDPAARSHPEEHDARLMAAGPKPAGRRGTD